MIKNPYFHQNTPENQLNTPTGAFLQYPEKKMVGAPLSTPEPGFTSIIIPCFFNSYSIYHYTGHCIGSIREHTDKFKTPYEIIMVINGNTGIGWFDRESEKWGGLPASEAHVDKIIPNEKNLGYAVAVNQGIRAARGEYVALVNNDTMVFNHWLEDLQEALGHVDLVQATPMYGMPFARATEADLLREEAMEKPIEESLSDFRDFSCVLTKKVLFSQVGMFDERFFCYGEDLDLMRRIEREKGKIASSKRVRTFHIISGTANSIKETPEIMNKSKELLREIWGY